MLIDAAGFWSWALKRYQNPHTRDLLLALQESDDVIILEVMFVAWLGTRRQQLDHTVWRQLRDSISPWVDCVVKPLREQRQAWSQSGNTIDLKSRMLAVELEAERQLAELLCSALTSELPSGDVVCVDTNLQLLPELCQNPDVIKQLSDVFQG
jgi:uncharacterized protein (TIGR02444 family)